MAQFKFNTVSRVEISESPGGNQMLAAIDYDGDRNLFITGVPGSGKTTVSLMRAEGLAGLGKNVLLITYQDLLVTSLKNSASRVMAKSIGTFYKWFYDITRKLVSELTAEELIEALKGLKKFDEIMIDEGQDFEMKVIKCLLTIGVKVTASADNAQRVHQRGVTVEQIQAEMTKIGAVQPIALQYNYRNTYGIYNFARFFLPYNQRANNQLAMERIPKGRGEAPSIFLVQSEDDREAQLKILLANAGDRNVAVLVFSPAEVEHYHKLIGRIGFSCSKHHSKDHLRGKIENILVTTLTSAKGVEFQAVILPNLETALERYGQTGEHYYVGCTRPKESLYLIALKKLPGCFRNFEKDSYKLINYGQK
jgi:superfamily I DNA/RNA helicase